MSTAVFGHCLIIWRTLFGHVLVTVWPSIVGVDACFLIYWSGVHDPQAGVGNMLDMCRCVGHICLTSLRPDPLVGHIVVVFPVSTPPEQHRESSEHCKIEGLIPQARLGLGLTRLRAACQARRRHENTVVTPRHAFETVARMLLQCCYNDSRHEVMVFVCRTDRRATEREIKTP